MLQKQLVRLDTPSLLFVFGNEHIHIKIHADSYRYRYCLQKKIPGVLYLTLPCTYIIMLFIIGIQVLLGGERGRVTKYFHTRGGALRFMTSLALRFNIVKKFLGGHRATP